MLENKIPETEAEMEERRRGWRIYYKENRRKIRIRQRLWYRINSKAVLEQMEKYRREKKRKRLKIKRKREWAKAWEENNSDKIERYRAQGRIFLLDNKDKVNTRRRERYAENPGPRKNQSLGNRVQVRIKTSKPRTVEEFLHLGGEISVIRARKGIDRKITNVKLESLVSREEFDFIVTKGL